MNAYPRHIKKDYQSKNLQNPFFQKRPAAKKRGRWKWILPLALITIAALIWLIFIAPFWHLNKIELNGLTRVPVQDVEAIIWAQADEPRLFSLSRGNIFLFDSEAAEQALIAAYNLTGCRIEKKLPHTLKVTGYERPYAFIWQEGKDSFYASGDGYVIKDQPVTDEDKQKYFILENKNPGTLVGTENKINVNDDYLRFIMELDELIKSSGELKPERYIIEWEFNTLKVKFQDGPQAYFNTKDLAAAQLDRLLLVKKEKIKDNFNRTEYIDLRYGDKIFINPDFK